MLDMCIVVHCRASLAEVLTEHLSHYKRSERPTRRVSFKHPLRLQGVWAKFSGRHVCPKGITNTGGLPHRCANMSSFSSISEMGPSLHLGERDWDAKLEQDLIGRMQKRALSGRLQGKTRD